MSDQPPIRAVTECPRCGGRLTISNEPRLLSARAGVGRAALWLNCGGCGLFAQAYDEEATREAERCSECGETGRHTFWCKAPGSLRAHLKEQGADWVG